MQQHVVIGASKSEASAFQLNFLDLLGLAAARGASDVHIDPLDGALRIRFRIDGLLSVVQWVQGEAYGARFFQQARRLCGFDMGRVGVPQDGRLRVEVIPYDLRASLIPTLYGEKIVLRLLQRGKKFSLADYEMPPVAKADLRRVLNQWQGLILITGPTGSGKTTLLYSALSELDAEENNIHTLEDPVEYELPGLIQSPVSTADMTFGTALRALMRQDPDAIMVGEIRDEETAKAAVHAAATGHLVLSTVHASSAEESVARLHDLGIAEAQVRANLLFSSSQRLVPRNCSACAEPDAEGTRLACQVLNEELQAQVSRGCSACNNTGVQGRVLLFEHLTFQVLSATGQRVLRRHGSLRDHALDFLRKGVLSAQHAFSFE